MNTIGVIPCRYNSKRFPGKPIALICGKPMVVRVWEQASRAKSLTKIVVATDDLRIRDICNEYSIDVVLTSFAHITGTDRVAEVADRIRGDVFVNIQGDEPLIDPAGIDRVASELQKNESVLVSNGYSGFSLSDDVSNPNLVKVITDVKGFAIAFSRYPIPFIKGETVPWKRQLGLYAFRQSILKQFLHWPRGELERAEEIEMLRFLEHGHRIKMVEISEEDSIPVDYPDDIEKIESIILKKKHKGRQLYR